MPWFRVDDDFALHPKAIAAGNAALGLWVRAGAYAAQYLTEGHIPAGILPRLGGRPRDAAKLVEAGLWTVEAGGWRFHQWEERQPTRAQVEADRAAAAERQRKARQRARDRRNGIDPDLEPPPDEPPPDEDPGPVDDDDPGPVDDGRSQGESRRDAATDRPGIGQGSATDRPQIGQGSSADRPHNPVTPQVTPMRHGVTHGPPGPARPGPAPTNTLLAYVGRLAGGDARDVDGLPAETVAAWQDRAGGDVDLVAEARAYLAWAGDRPARHPRAAWLGWLDKARERAASHAAAERRAADCTDPACHGGWLPPVDDRPRPCPNCKPHIRPAEEAS